MRWIRVVMVVLVGLLVAGGRSAAAEAAVTLEPGNGFSVASALTPDGRYVVFSSYATDLVPGGTTNTSNSFIRDTWLGTTRLVSVGLQGRGGNESSSSWANSHTVSADGRYVVFESWASDLVPGDTNGVGDVFVRDLLLGATRRISAGVCGAQTNHYSYGATISADGRYAAFSSSASNLVPGDTNNRDDQFVVDLRGGAIRLASVGFDGRPANGGSASPSLSDDGHYLSFSSAASNLVPNDTNNVADVFVRDLWHGSTTRAGVGDDESQGNGVSRVLPGSFEGSGRYIAFSSWADNLVPGDTNRLSDIFLRDLTLGTTSRINPARTGGVPNWDLGLPSLSRCARIVTFSSLAFDLVPGDTNQVADIFAYDRTRNTTIRASVSSTGQQGDKASWGESISSDGRHVIFTSSSSNLVPNDYNRQEDVFIRDLATGSTRLISARS